MRTTPVASRRGSRARLVNPLSRFSLNLGELPPRGSLATNLLGKLNADHALDLYLQRETLADWLELRVWTCPAAVFAHGLPHRVLGQATLTVGGSGELILGTLGNSGGDGAYAHLGQAEGWSSSVSELDPAVLPTGAFVQFMSAGSAGGDGNRLLGKAKLQDNGLQLDASFDFATLGANQYTLSIKSNGVVLGVIAHRTGVGASITNGLPVTASDSGKIAGNGPDEQGAVLSLKWPIAINISVPGSGQYQADELSARPELGANLFLIDYRQGVFVNAAQIPVVTLEHEQVGSLRHLIASVGDSSLHPSGGFLLVSSLTGSGNDGIEFALKSSDASVAVTWPELRDATSSDDWALVANSWVASELFGVLDGIPGQLLARGQATLSQPLTPLPFSLNADFSPLGGSGYRVRVLNNGVERVNSVLASGTEIARSQTSPRNWGHTWSSEEMWADFPAGTSFLVDGKTVKGDRISLLPVGASGVIGGHQGVRVTSSGLKELVVSDVCERVGVSCEPTELHVVTANDGSAVLYWEGCGYHLQATDSIIGAAVWTDLTSSSPLHLSADQPFRWFRLVCP